MLPCYEPIDHQGRVKRKENGIEKKSEKGRASKKGAIDELVGCWPFCCWLAPSNRENNNKKRGSVHVLLLLYGTLYIQNRAEGISWSWKFRPDWRASTRRVVDGSVRLRKRDNTHEKKSGKNNWKLKKKKPYTSLAVVFSFSFFKQNFSLFFGSGKQKKFPSRRVVGSRQREKKKQVWC